MTFRVPWGVRDVVKIPQGKGEDEPNLKKKTQDAFAPGFQRSKVLSNSGFEIKTQIPFDQSAHGKEHLVPCYFSVTAVHSGLGTRFSSFQGNGLRNSLARSLRSGAGRGSVIRSCVLPILMYSGQRHCNGDTLCPYLSLHSSSL